MKRAHVVFLVLAAVYLAAVAFELPLVRYQINPDGISYLAIAERYRAGDFGGAINAYWGPMFSWLLAPLLALGIGPLLACKVLTFTIGLATLFGSWFLSARYTRSLVIRAIVTAALIPLIVFWAGSLVTPDIFVVCALTYYAYFISDPAVSRRSILLAAVFGALAYFSKSYAFVFFLVHFPAVAAVRWFCAKQNAGRRKMLQSAALGLAVFSALSLPWIAAISVKAGRLTFGTAGRYNLEVVGLTNDAATSRAHRFQTPGLHPPDDASASSVWESPVSPHSTNWLSPAATVGRFADLTKQNAPLVFKYLQAISPVALLILAASFFIAAWRWRTSTETGLIAGTIASGALYSAGYVLVLVEPRYLWILAILLLMLAASVVESLLRQKLPTLLAICLAVVVAGSFVVSPLSELPRLNFVDRATTEAVRALAREGVDLRGRRLASDSERTHTLYVSYFAGARYFGATGPRDPVVVRNELDEYRVDTFFVWGARAAAAEYLNGFHEVPVTAPAFPFAVYQR